jgi:hypothetical protein
MSLFDRLVEYIERATFKERVANELEFEIRSQIAHERLKHGFEEALDTFNKRYNKKIVGAIDLTKEGRFALIIQEVDNEREYKIYTKQFSRKESHEMTQVKFFQILKDKFLDKNLNLTNPY